MGDTAQPLSGAITIIIIMIVIKNLRTQQSNIGTRHARSLTKPSQQLQ
jgi:hypothetical protein